MLDGARVSGVGPVRTDVLSLSWCLSSRGRGFPCHVGSCVHPARVPLPCLLPDSLRVRHDHPSPVSTRPTSSSGLSTRRSRPRLRGCGVSSEPLRRGPQRGFVPAQVNTRVSSHLKTSQRVVYFTLDKGAPSLVHGLFPAKVRHGDNGVQVHRHTHRPTHGTSFRLVPKLVSPYTQRHTRTHVYLSMYTQQVKKLERSSETPVNGGRHGSRPTSSPARPGTETRTSVWRQGVPRFRSTPMPGFDGLRSVSCRPAYTSDVSL